MNVHGARRIVLVATTLAVFGGACGGGGGAEGGAAGRTSNDVANGGFATPLPNRIDVHRETAHGDHQHEAAPGASGALQVALVSSEIVVGHHRFAVGLFDGAGSVIHDADVRFLYFDTQQVTTAVLESIADARRLQSPDGATTIYAHERDFDRVGPWGVEVQATWPDGRTARQRISFDVVADATSLVAGERAPSVHTPTLTDVDGDVTRLTSAVEPDPALHTISLDAAIESGRPTLVLFATPAYCQTRFCGPAYEIASELRRRHGDRLNHVYVEIFAGLPDPAAAGWELAPAVAAFGLQSEPWLYLIDAEGKIVHRVEGMFTVEEIEEHLRADFGM